MVAHRRVPARAKVVCRAMLLGLLAYAAPGVRRASAFGPHAAAPRDFTARCSSQFQRCEDRIVDVAISLIMESNPLFCDPKDDDPTQLAQQALAWMSTHPVAAGPSLSEKIAEALVHVRPCADDPWGRRH